eukprot:1140523-Pelagomonas_calceolata.AAC.6
MQHAGAGAQMQPHNAACRSSATKNAACKSRCTDAAPKSSMQEQVHGCHSPDMSGSSGGTALPSTDCTVDATASATFAAETAGVVAAPEAVC